MQQSFRACCTFVTNIDVVLPETLLEHGDEADQPGISFEPALSFTIKWDTDGALHALRSERKAQEVQKAGAY